MKSFKEYIKESDTFSKTEIQDVRNMMMLFVRKQNRSKKIMEKFSNFMLAMSKADGNFADKIQKGIEESGIRERMLKDIFENAKNQINDTKLDSSRKDFLIEFADAVLMDLG